MRMQQALFSAIAVRQPSWAAPWSPAPTTGGGPPPMPRNEVCKENPGKCDEARARREEFCKANPQKCEEQREQMKAKKAERQEFCKANPETCKEQREQMKQKRAERQEFCKANPEKCEEQREQMKAKRAELRGQVQGRPGQVRRNEGRSPQEDAGPDGRAAAQGGLTGIGDMPQFPRCQCGSTERGN